MRAHDPILRSPSLKFLGLVFTFILAANFVLRLPWIDNTLVRPYAAFIARISGVILNTIGLSVQASGTTIHHNSFGVDIRRGCDGDHRNHYTSFCLLGLSFYLAGQPLGDALGLRLDLCAQSSSHGGTLLLGSHEFKPDLPILSHLSLTVCGRCSGNGFLDLLGRKRRGNPRLSGSLFSLLWSFFSLAECGFSSSRCNRFTKNFSPWRVKHIMQWKVRKSILVRRSPLSSFGATERQPLKQQLSQQAWSPTPHCF